MTFGVFLILACYFTPWLVALAAHHRNRYAILALNIFLGWTGIGWILALVWALTRDPKPA